MIRHINPTLQLPDGRFAKDIADEGEAERIVNEMQAEVTGIETQITSATAYEKVGRRVDLHWLYRARKAAGHRKELIRAIRGALKVMRREEHQRREAIRLAAGPETPEQKRQRVELANAQHETDCALFVAEMREQLPRDEYLAVWQAVHEKKAADPIADSFLVRIGFRPDGGLRIVSPDVPGLLLSHHSEHEILSDMMTVLRSAKKGELC